MSLESSVESSGGPIRKIRGAGKKDRIYSIWLKQFDDKKKCLYCSYQAPISLSASSAQRHIQRIHPEIYNLECEKKSNTMPNLIDFSSNRLLVLAVATSTVPIRFICENYYFRTFLESLEVKIDSREEFLEQMLDEQRLLEKQIQSLLHDSEHVTITAATTRGMRYSYLGVVAHFWARDEHHTIALDVKELLFRRTAENLRDAVLKVVNFYKIPDRKILRFVTDSASNMKPGFFNPFIRPPQLCDIKTDIELDDVLLDSVPNEIYVTEQEQYEKYIKMLENCVDYFNAMETCWSALPKHTSCAAHRLQLVLKDVFEKNTSENGKMCIALRKKVFKLLAKFAHSHNATKMLYTLSGYKLLFPANTSWNSIELTYSRLLEIWDHVKVVCAAQKPKKWEFLVEEDRALILVLLKCLKNFRNLTDLLQADKATTFSLLYPGIHGIMKQFESDLDQPELAEQLNQSIMERFADVLVSGSSEDSDPAFIAAAFMDPEALLYLPNDFEEELKAKRTIAILCENLVPIESSFYNSQREEESNQDLGRLSFLQPLTPKRQRNDDISLEEEINNFFIARKGANFRHVNATEFWNNNSWLFPRLSVMAKILLSVPATSAAVERLFSQVSIHTDRHKNRTPPQTLRTRVLLSYNSKYIP